MSKKIMAVIDKRGNTSFEGVGFEGDECIAATKSFEEVLAGVEVGREYKDEYYDAPGATTGNEAYQERM